MAGFSRFHSVESNEDAGENNGDGVAVEAPSEQNFEAIVSKFDELIAKTEAQNAQ